MIERSAHERWVQAFVDGWKDATDGDELVDRFEPWVQPDYTFIDPWMRRPGVGLEDLRRRFFRPLLTVMRDVRVTVERWAGRDDTIFLELVIEGRVGDRRPVRIQAVDRVILVNGLASERHTYVDPMPLALAVARTPRAWWLALRAQLAR